MHWRSLPTILLHTVWLGPEKAEGHILQGLGQGLVYEEQDLNKRLRCTGIGRLAVEAGPGVFAQP